MSLNIKTNRLLRGAYEALPESAKNMYRIACSLPEHAIWKLSASGKLRSEQLLGPWHNKYKGQRAIIMGNGPSLKSTDWSLIKNEYTFGLNRINLLFDEMGFIPSFYVCVKDLVIEQFHEELDSIPCQLKVFNFMAARNLISVKPEHVFLRFVPGLSFCTDIRNGWSGGFTVTYSALQLAYFLGFQKIILIGVDHKFTAPGAPRSVETRDTDDPNHFAPNYFGKGVKWALPDLEGSERAYQLAKAAYEADGRSIVDATNGGLCAVFQRMSLVEALA